MEQSETAASPQTARQSLFTLLTRAVFSFPGMVAAALVVLTFLTVSARLNDPDLWWHLKVGEIIWNTHSIPRTDLFSWTTNNHAWTAHEWLAQVFIYTAWKTAGYSGLFFWLAAVSSLLIVAQYILCSLYSGNAKVALVGALVAWLFGTVGFSIRPQLVGYLLLTIELLIIHLGRTRNPRYFFLLPVLFWIWVDCHGSYFFGIAVAAVFLATSFVELNWGSLVSLRWEARARRLFIISVVLAGGALFINPVGIRQILYPLDVMLNQPVGLSFVTEWQPLDLNDSRSSAMFGVAALVFALVLLRRVELRLDELLLFAMGFAFAIRHDRMLFVFGLLAAPIVSRLLAKEWDNYEFARDRRLPNIIMIAISLAIIWTSFPTVRDLEAQVRKGNPVKAVEFIKRSGLPGPMLNEYNFGGYLIWALPEHKVFIDGRADVFEWTGLFTEFAKWATLQQDPKILLDRHGVNFCLLAANSPMSHILPYMPGWKAIYTDDQAVIFRRTSPSE